MADVAYEAPEARAPGSAPEETAKKVETNAERATLRERARRAAATRPFVAYMVAVTVLAAFYYGVIATPLYVSETQFAIRSKEVDTSSGFLSGLLGTDTGISDIVAVSNFIGSHDMLNQLQRRFDLRKQYSQPRIDPFQWLSKNSSQENFQSYFRRHVVVKLDREADTVIVDVKSFKPKEAQQTAFAVLELTEQFVNGMSQRLRDDSLASSKNEFERAQQAANQARGALSNFRGDHSDLDPSTSGAFLVSSLGTLQSAAVSAQNQLASLKTYSKPDAPAVKQLQAQLNNINEQIDETKSKQSGTSKKPQQVTTFETLELNRADAERTVSSAQTAYDAARASAEQKEKFVVRIVSPNMPQKPTSPDRLLDFITVLIFAVAGYALFSLSVASIRDHRGI